MSLEERISRLEERIAELLISQATLNDRHEQLVSRVVRLETRNEDLVREVDDMRFQLQQLMAYLDMEPNLLRATGDDFGMVNWLEKVVKRRVN